MAVGFASLKGPTRSTLLRRLTPFLLLFAALSAQPAVAATVRINAGGSAYVDTASNTWSADNSFNGSSTVNWGAVGISGTSDPTLYRTERYASNLQYTITVPNDTYTVKLYFAENFVDSTFPNGGVGFRVFSVQANGTTIVNNLDLFATAGAHAAVVKSAVVTVSGSQLVLSFSNGGFVNAIELIGQGGAADTTPPTVPGGVNAVAQTNSSIKVTWNASTDGGTGVGGYKIFRNGGASPVGNVSGTTFTDTGLAANTAYSYTVSAYDLASPANESVPSSSAGATTLSATAGNVYQCNDSGATGRLTIDANTIGRTANMPNCTNMVSVPLANAGVTLQRWHPLDQADPFAVWQPIGSLPSGWSLWTPNGWMTLAQVQSSGGGGGGGSDTTPPTVPGNPAANAQSTSSILVSWSASTDASGVAGYIVRRNGSALPTTSSTSYLDTGLSANTTYNYTVSALDNASPANESSQTGSVQAKTLASADTSPPTMPTGVSATALSSSSISLTWNASTDSGTGVAGYKIFRNGSGTPLTNVSTTSYTDTGLSASTLYSYTVSAYDLASPPNESFQSASASATTQSSGGGGGTGQVYQCNDNGASGRVAVDNNSLGLGVNFPNCSNMVAVAYNVAALTLQRWHPANAAEPWGVWQSMGSLPSGWSVWTPSGWQTLAQLQGGGGGGGGADTTPPTVPSGLNASAVSSSQINLSWGGSTDSGSGLAGYKVYRNGSFVTTTANTNYSDTGRSPSTTYSYSVSAYDLASPANESAQSTPASATTQSSGGGGGSSGQVYQCNDAGASGRLAVDVNVLNKPYNFPNCGNMVAIDYNSASLTLQRWHPNDPQDPDAFWQARDLLPQGWTMWTPNGWQTLAQLAGINVVDTTPPSVPNGLAALASSISTIQLNWNASTDATTTVRGYRVFRNGNLVGTPTYPNFIDSGLSSGTTYTYTVSALDEASPPNESGQSGSASATTFGGGGGGGGTSGGGWAWMGGPQKGGNWSFNGQYGFKGVASASNYPGSRFQNMGWKDSSGNLWMMGGYGSDAGGSYGRMDDIWKFDVNSNQWTWIAGQNYAQVNPVYGSQGQASSNNTPGGRSASAVWSNGSDAYIFGGIWINGFYELMGDLWKFNMNTGQWTWLKGGTSSNTGGTCFTGNGNDSPGGRKGAAFWNDGSGNLWMFGGIGYDCGGGQSVMNDLWKYNISSNTWTLVTGSAFGTPGSNYGSFGQAGGTPGGRQDAQFWRDNSGNLWVFGGLNSAGGQLSDLWKYSIGSNQWTWMGGATFANATGNYGTLGSSSGGTPGARRGGAGSFDGTYAWVFGGFGWDAFGNKENLNDLWRYDPSNGQWTWMSGSNATGSAGNYGSFGSTGSSTAPPARNDFAFWTDNNGRLWVGQGEGPLSSSNHLADIFRY